MRSIERYELTEQESKLIGAVATTEEGAREHLGVDDAEGLYMHLANLCMVDPDGYCMAVTDERATLVRDAAADARVAHFIVCCFKYGIVAGSEACANDLGALFYMGEIVDRNYELAEELYQIAMERGCYQSIVNLGYIYEYGRLGTPDPAKAFEHYALAAALEPTCEALYKLGDAYSRATFVEHDARRAFSLWTRALSLANNPEDQAQAAFRLAGLFLYGDWDAGVDPDPLQALRLYQAAELGLRISVSNGMHFYKKRLEESIEGQEKARVELSLLENL